MEIVILDGYALNPGDLPWEEFEKLGRVTLYDRTPAELTAWPRRRVSVCLKQP